MIRQGPRGTVWGLLAVLGYLFGLLWLSWLIIETGTAAAALWSGPVYSLAFGMGLWQLVLVLWGNRRHLRGVRFSRRLEHPPDAAGGDRR